ncbi:response regulator transcription factor [Paenibacillus oleatilyticus]|uniref:response regulator transcription factor n=1 Tax=Paenibacillus oleatilyticus TaxID=2594886 RepID=UPI001C1FE7F4|nr:response regulator transcription factor [Paenibacillus oleatilyticus]MBU7319862.1 response regulator transcription factor [Paenibacillus oleatilyticus]
MIRVLIVDDDPFIRESMKMILELDPELRVVGACGDGNEAHRFFTDGQTADVVLMDIRMPNCSGVEGTLNIKRASPDTRVLILTTFDDDDYIVEALRNGASGYLLKNIPPDRIVQGIKTVHQGNWLIHPDIARKLTGWIHPQSPAQVQAEATLEQVTQSRKDPFARFESYGLTPTEKQVVEKIAEGLSNKEIAQELFLSEGTIKNYISEILSKLGLRDRTQIAILYWKHED